MNRVEDIGFNVVAEAPPQLSIHPRLARAKKLVSFTLYVIGCYPTSAFQYSFHAHKKFPWQMKVSKADIPSLSIAEQRKQLIADRRRQLVVDGLKTAYKQAKKLRKDRANTENR